MPYVPIGNYSGGSRPHAPRTRQTVSQVVAWISAAAVFVIGAVIVAAVIVARAVHRDADPDDLAGSIDRYSSSSSFSSGERPARHPGAGGGGGNSGGGGRSRIDQLLPEGSQMYSQQDLNAWLPELRTTIESVVGRTFKSIPPLRVIHRDELRQIMAGEAADSLGAGVLDDLPGEVEMTAIVVMGLYDPDAGVVYMIPGNLATMMERDGVEHDLRVPIAKLVLAHELTHALQDQLLDLKHLEDSTKNVEEEQALRATIEGHARMVEEMVGLRLGLEYVHEDVEEPPRRGDMSDDALIEALMGYESLISDLYYVKGSEFFKHNFERGGAKQVWRILTDPPKTTAAFIDPARYWQPGQSTGGGEELLKGLSANFGGGPWTEENFSPGSFTLRLMYRGMGPKNADAFVTSIQSARALVLTNGSDGFASIAAFEQRGTPNADAFVQWLERVPPGLLMETMHVDDESISYTGTRKLSGFDAPIAREMKFDVAGGQGGRVVRIAKGNRIVEITDAGAGLTDQQCAELAKEIFGRFERGKSGAKSNR